MSIPQSGSTMRGILGIVFAMFVGLSLATMPKIGIAMAADEVSNKATVEKAFNAWANGTGSPYDLLDADVTWTITGNSKTSKTYPSRDAFMNEVIKPFNARMSVGLKPNIRNIYADGNTVIV